MEEVFRLGYPTATIDRVGQSNLISDIRDVIVRVRPEVIYLVNGGDVHTDHRVVYSSTMSVTKAFHMRSLGVNRVLCSEILSSTEAAPPQDHGKFVPNTYSDISPFLERKLEIMNLYESELQEDPFPRGPSAIRSLARLRGATIGVEYAEALMLVREIG